MRARVSTYLVSDAGRKQEQGLPRSISRGEVGHTRLEVGHTRLEVGHTHTETSHLLDHLIGHNRRRIHISIIIIFGGRGPPSLPLCPPCPKTPTYPTTGAAEAASIPT